METEPVMTERALQTIFTDILSCIAPKKKYHLSVKFYKTKSISHTIQLRQRDIQIKIAQSFDKAPEYILRSLGIILFSKLFRFKVDSKTRREYRQFIEDSILPDHKQHIRKPSPDYTAYGDIYNLNFIFEDINRAYFQNQLNRPVLGWSLNKSYTRLGFYSDEKNLLVISRIFDSPRVPLRVVEYMMYHEMLHIAIPTKIVNGRRSVHPPEFKKQDRAFPGYDEIQKWIKKHRVKL